MAIIMKHYSNLVSAIGLALVSVMAGCNNNIGNETAYMLPEAKTMSLTSEQKSMVNDNNTFSLNLFNQTVKSEKDGKSVFMSPIGVSLMLGMIQSGANDETQQQTATAMGFKGYTSQAINEWCHSIQTQAPELDQNVTFLDANAIYLNKQYDLQSSFKKDMQNYYEAGIDNLDFSSTKAANTINKWSEKHTDGMIPQVIDKTEADAVMYLLNAVYFEAKWTKQFDKANTKEETFTKEDGSTISVPMMHNKALVRAYETDDYVAVWLPYGSGTTWNMIVLLPKGGKTVAEIANELKDIYNELLNHGERMELDIKIPKFSLQTKYDLIKKLKTLGITNIFNSNNSGLTGICKIQGNDREVFVSDMFQKAALDVTEEGSKATAVTVAEVMMTSVGPEHLSTGEFHADHPFLFLITENNSDAIFFAGTFTGK